MKKGPKIYPAPSATGHFGGFCRPPPGGRGQKPSEKTHDRPPPRREGSATGTEPVPKWLYDAGEGGSSPLKSVAKKSTSSRGGKLPFEQHTHGGSPRWSRMISIANWTLLMTWRGAFWKTVWDGEEKWCRRVALPTDLQHLCGGHFQPHRAGLHQQAPMLRLADTDFLTVQAEIYNPGGSGGLGVP